MSKTCQVSSMRTAFNFVFAMLWGESWVSDKPRLSWILEGLPWPPACVLVVLAPGRWVGLHWFIKKSKLWLFWLAWCEDIDHRVIEQMFLREWMYDHMQPPDLLSWLKLTFRPCWRPNSCSSVLICWGKWDVPRRGGSSDNFLNKTHHFWGKTETFKEEEIFIIHLRFRTLVRTSCQQIFPYGMMVRFVRCIPLLCFQDKVVSQTIQHLFIAGGAWCNGSEFW